MHEVDSKINEVDEQSEFIKEAMTQPPKWIFKYGISLFFVLICLILCLSYCIKYPDILTADITLTTLHPPVILVAKNNGKLTHLLVKNGTVVKAQQTIAVIENTSNYIDVLYLYDNCSRLLEHLKLNDTLPNIILKDTLNVGEITPNYLLVLKSMKDLNLYKEVNSYKKQISLLHKDLVSYKDLLSKYKQQQNLNNQELELIEKDYNRDNSLLKEGAISTREFENKKKEYLKALNSNEATKITLSNTLIQINSIEKNILQFQIQDYQERSKLNSELQQNAKSLISEINKWKQLYLIESPTDGKISFFNVWVTNQNINAEDELFAVVPTQKQQFIGKCILPILNTGKLSIGQIVNIKLDNYPYNENGMLQGTVTSISEVPNNDTYSIDVELKNGLTTTYNKTLQYKEQMKGTADIITKNISVMDRIFFNFKALVDRK